jgi:mRNA interferase MazF
MVKLLRGDICWADLEPTRGKEQAGRRPVLIISRDVFNLHSGTVIAMALTSQPQRAGFPLTEEVPPGVLREPGWVKISQVRTLAVERLGQRIGHLGEDAVNRVVEGLSEIVGG